MTIHQPSVASSEPVSTVCCANELTSLACLQYLASSIILSFFFIFVNLESPIIPSFTPVNYLVDPKPARPFPILRSLSCLFCPAAPHRETHTCLNEPGDSRYSGSENVGLSKTIPPPPPADCYDGTACECNAWVWLRGAITGHYEQVPGY